MTDCSADVLFQDADLVRKSPVLCIGADEGYRGKDFLCIRAHVLDSSMEPLTMFWQVRRMVNKNHAALCEAVVSAFTEVPAFRRGTDSRRIRKEIRWFYC